MTMTLVIIAARRVQGRHPQHRPPRALAVVVIVLYVVAVSWV